MASLLNPLKKKKEIVFRSRPLRLERLHRPATSSSPIRRPLSARAPFFYRRSFLLPLSQSLLSQLARTRAALFSPCKASVLSGSSFSPCRLVGFYCRFGTREDEKQCCVERRVAFLSSASRRRPPTTAVCRIALCVYVSTLPKF